MLLTVLLLGYVAAVQLTAACPYQPEEPTNGGQLEELTNGDQLMEPTNGDQTITELKPRGSIDDKGTTDGQNKNGEVKVPLYRYYTGDHCDHFYTTNAKEIGTITPGITGNHGYTSEGSEGLIHSIQSRCTIPLHRYSRGGDHGDHFYTTNVNEIGTTTFGMLGKYGYVYQWVAGYCFPTQFPGTIPLHRYYKGGSCNDHLYTTKASEIGTDVVGVVGKDEYRYEGVACYIEPTP